MTWPLISKLRRLVQKRHGEIDEEFWIIPMSIHKLGYEGKDYTVPRYGRLDPGSQVNLVSERILEELGYEYYHNKSMKILMLGGSELQPVGDITLKWHLEGKEDKPGQVHTTDFTVIAKDVPVSFDFLLGRGWCAETRALKKNPEVLCLDKMTRVARTTAEAEADLNLVPIASFLQNHDNKTMKMLYDNGLRTVLLQSRRMALDCWRFFLKEILDIRGRVRLLNPEKQGGYTPSGVDIFRQYFIFHPLYC
jgi:hypothetical protein